MKPASRTHDAESTLLGKQKTRGGKEVAKSGEASEGSHLVQRYTFTYIYNLYPGYGIAYSISEPTGHGRPPTQRERQRPIFRSRLRTGFFFCRARAHFFPPSNLPRVYAGRTYGKWWAQHAFEFLVKS